MKLRFNQTMVSFPGRCFIIFCLVLKVHVSVGQMCGNYRRDSVDIARIPEMEIALDPNANEDAAEPAVFKSIQVIDVRYDTTLIGIYSLFTNGFTPTLKNYKVNLQGGLPNGVRQYLNSFFREAPSTSDRELICFIKKFSLARRDTIAANQSTYKKYSQLDFEAEVFLRSGTDYYAGIKIDTILYSVIDTKKKQVNDEMERYLLTPGLQLLRHRISSTKWEDVSKRKPFTEKAVLDHYLIDRFNIPVLTGTVRKGIYRSFAEFKNNRPYMEDFTVADGKFNTVQLEDSKGNNISTLKLFGYCDGEKYWLLMGSYSFPLFRVGNGFEFFLTFSKRIKILSSLNMENGKVY